MKELAKTCIVAQAQPSIADLGPVIGQFTKCIVQPETGVSFVSLNRDFTFKFAKSLHSKLKAYSNPELVKTILTNSIPAILALKDENYCKDLEYLLKIVYRLIKYDQSSLVGLEPQLRSILGTIMEHFSVNPNLLSLYIKLLSVIIDASSKEQVDQICEIAQKYAYAD